MSSNQQREDREARSLVAILAGIVAALVLLAATVVVIGIAGDDEGDDGPRPTASTASTATAAPTTLPAGGAAATAVFPPAGSAARYDDPVEAARAFAVDFAGFRDPIVGELRAGDNRSGEVEVRPTADGPATTVLVRQLLADDTWWVLGTFTENIELGHPGALDVVSSPLRVEGRARAFEGTVEVAIREDGNPTPLATGFVTGSGGEDLGPFDERFPFSTPAQRGGALVLTTRSAEDGRVWEAAVLRILFAAP